MHSFFHLRAATFAFASWVCHVWDKGRRGCRISGIVLVIRWVLNHPELVREVGCQWWVLAEAWDQLNNENKVSLVLDNYSELPVCHSQVVQVGQRMPRHHRTAMSGMGLLEFLYKGFKAKNWQKLTKNVDFDRNHTVALLKKTWVPRYTYRK